MYRERSATPTELSLQVNRSPITRQGPDQFVTLFTTFTLSSRAAVTEQSGHVTFYFDHGKGELAPDLTDPQRIKTAITILDAVTSRLKTLVRHRKG
ncbi:MAG: hypothetical protein WCP97_02720 [bacterium]